MSIPNRHIVFRHRLGNRAIGEPPEFWIEVDYDSWMVGYRVAPQGGRPVVAEIRVFPREASRATTVTTPGEWSCEITEIPTGGISARLLRALRPGEDVAVGLKLGNRYVRLVPSAAARFQRAGFSRLKKQRVKRQRDTRGRIDIDRLLRAALFYAKRGGRRPVADLADAWHIGHRQATDLLQVAGEQGLLTRGTKGKTSRALTDKAKALLAKKESRQ